LRGQFLSGWDENVALYFDKQQCMSGWRSFQRFKNSDANSLRNGATFAAGKFGLAFHFDGINDHVVVPDNANLRPAQFTLEAWIKPSSTTGFDSVIAKGATGLTPGYHGDANAFWLGLADGKPRLYTGHFTTLDHYITGVAALTSNEWHHIAGKFDGAKRLYADVVLVASGTVASRLRYDNLDVPLSDSPTSLGSLVTILVSASDNVGVAELVLTVGGTPLAPC
jgi:hypothetical protein